MTLYATRGSYAKLKYGKIDIINFIYIRSIIFDFLPNIKRHCCLKFRYCEKATNLFNKCKPFFKINSLRHSLQSGRFLSKLCCLCRISEIYAGVLLKRANVRINFAAQYTQSNVIKYKPSLHSPRNFSKRISKWALLHL